MRLCENITAISNVKVSVLEVTDVILDTYMQESITKGQFYSMWVWRFTLFFDCRELCGFVVLQTAITLHLRR